ncbi:MAG: tetratricopeptide repeat protein [Acidobacteria bacterium]|nr:tetratricopeptide repeat protein [Acidobacteriota bacterium]
MISKRSALIILVLAIALAASAPSWAQFQGKITGRVVDPAGNPVEKAEVSIVSQKTSSVRYELKTDKEGRFLQIGLMPGYYLVTVKKSGFVSGSKAYSAADKAFLKGNKLFTEQKFEEAAAAYGEAIGLDPANWAYRLNLGLAFKKAGKAAEALAEFQKAVELNPESYSANKETGESLAKAGQYAEAKPFYEKAAGLSPDDPDAQYNFGVCLVNLGESEAALPKFQRAVELKPDYADAHYQMGTIFIGQNKAPEAIAALERFLAVAPDHEKAGIAKQLLDFLKK